MAKALLGHVGIGTDARLASEVRRLRTQVVDLENELARALRLNDSLAAAVTVEDDLRSLHLTEAAPV